MQLLETIATGLTGFMTKLLSRPFQRRPIYFCAQGETLSWQDLNGEGLQSIADAVGVECALELCANFGGTRLYVPKVPLDHNPIMILGRETALELCRLFGPERIEIPMQALNTRALKRIISAKVNAGESNSSIALDLGISWRLVARYVPASHKVSDKIKQRLTPSFHTFNSDGCLVRTHASKQNAANDKPTPSILTPSDGGLGAIAPTQSNHTPKNQTNAPAGFPNGNPAHGKKETTYV